MKSPESRGRYLELPIVTSNLCQSHLFLIDSDPGLGRYITESSIPLVGMICNKSLPQSPTASAYLHSSSQTGGSLQPGQRRGYLHVSVNDGQRRVKGEDVVVLQWHA